MRECHSSCATPTTPRLLQSLHALRMRHPDAFENNNCNSNCLLLHLGGHNTRKSTLRTSLAPCAVKKKAQANRTEKDYADELTTPVILAASTTLCSSSGRGNKRGGGKGRMVGRELSTPKQTSHIMGGLKRRGTCPVDN